MSDMRVDLAHYLSVHFEVKDAQQYLRVFDHILALFQALQ